MSPDTEPQRREFARRLRAFMGYADRTLDSVAASLQALGVPASPSTVNRWARGQSAPSVFAAGALAQLVEEAGLAPPGDGTKWLLGKVPVAARAPAVRDLDAAVRDWNFRTSTPELADALAERGVPAAYRKPLAELLERIIAEQGDPPDRHDDR